MAKRKAKEPGKGQPAAATIKRCTRGHSWAVPFIGPDLGCIGFADVQAGLEVCTRCLVTWALTQQQIGTVVRG